MIKIFISHSSEDKEIVKYFVNNILQLGMGFSRDEIFCTSSEGMGIQSGEDWRKKIKDSFSRAETIILLITPNYKASEICQNEMGAAWISDKLIIPLIVGPITYKNVGVVMEPKQIDKLNAEGLDRIQECLLDKFPEMKNKINAPNWSSQKKDLLLFLKNYLDNNDFPLILNQDEIREKNNKIEILQKGNHKLLEENKDLRKKISELEAAKDRVEVNAINKKHVSTEVVDQFDDLVKNAHSALSKVSEVVRTVVYNTI